MTQEKKNYFCSWKEPKGATSICLPYGRLSLLFVVSGAVWNSSSCSSHLPLCPRQGAENSESCAPSPGGHRLSPSLAACVGGGPEDSFSQGANYMLSSPEKVQSTPNRAVLESERSFPKAAPSPSLWSGTLHGGKGRAWQRNRLKAREQIAAETGISVLVGG